MPTTERPSEAVPVVGYGAPTALAAQNRDLHFRGIDEVVLDPRAGRLSMSERTDMPVASARHFLRQRLVPLIERGEFAAPTACFRVTAITLAVLSKNAPEPVELAMLTEQMLPAQQ